MHLMIPKGAVRTADERIIAAAIPTALVFLVCMKLTKQWQLVPYE